MDVEQRQLITSARLTGVWYLTLAISGILGFMIFHSQIFIADDPRKTLTNLTNLESISRIRLLLELIIVVSQALAAAWFYKLFREIDPWAAWTIGVWGMMNSAIIMISAISMGSAIEIAKSATPSYEDKVVAIQLLLNLITNAWGIGGIFFGLWLLPMGYIVIKSKRMPVWLGRVLIIGGIGYLLHTFINSIGIDHNVLEFLVIPATAGEFWMIGYLLIYGIRPMSHEK